MRRFCGGHGFFVARMGMGWCALGWRTHFFILGGMLSGRYDPLLGNYRKKST